MNETSSFNSYSKDEFHDGEQIRLKEFCPNQSAVVNSNDHRNITEIVNDKQIKLYHITWCLPNLNFQNHCVFPVTKFMHQTIFSHFITRAQLEGIFFKYSGDLQ